jgi:iron complex transport system permease protein
MLQFFLNTKMRMFLVVFLLILFVGAFLSSIIFGRTPITMEDAVAAFMSYDQSSTEHMIIHTERLPRAVIGTVVGASLAVAGALMQALTRNPLASPSVFGINAGAILFIVIAVILFSISSLLHLMWFAFFGAAISAIMVYFLGSLGRDGLTPIKIVLAGSALSALFLSFTQAILVLDETGMQDVLFWLAGSISGRTLEMLLPVLPFMIMAVVISMFMGRAINLLTTGEDIAKGMGQKTVLVKASMGLMVVLLAGGSVAVVGAVAFIGLVIPHIARTLVGNDYRWVIPFSAMLGAILLLSADVVARLVIMPQEVPIGVMTAFIGAPFFVYIARKGVAKK